jgi:exopolysaccharide biosynthesis protein
MAEGFTEAKVLSQSLARSAVGVTKEGRLLLVSTGELKMQELAALMLMLGAEDAMSLDGGASSGLWFDGKYVAKPGREIPNAILVYER